MSGDSATPEITPELTFLTREFLTGHITRREWMGKMLMAGVSLAGLSYVLAACGGAAATISSSGTGGKGPTIGFVIPLISNPYWELMQNFALECAKQFNINLVTGQANSDDNTQLSIVQDFISRKVDGMVVGAVDNTVGQPILSAVTQANIPLTFMQRLPGVDPNNFPKKVLVGYVGTDDATAGFASAQMLYNAGPRKWVGLTGAAGNSVAVVRLQGMQKFVQQHSDVTLLHVQYGNEARSSGQTTMEDYLSAYPGPSFDGVWSFNDEGALGAISALSNANVTKEKVVMIDGTVDGCDAVQGGSALATFGGGYACGTFALIELYDALHGKYPDNRNVNMPLIPVTQQTVTAYQEQVVNGASSYNFKAASAVFTPGAGTKDYKIVLH